MMVSLQLYQLQRPFSAPKKSLKNRRSSKSLICSSSLQQEDCPHLKNAAQLIADSYIKDGSIVGIGTGTVITSLLAELAQRLDDKRLTSIKCVPSSNASASEAAFHGVPLTTLEESNDGKVDVLIDVADQISLSDLSYITGRGDNGPQTAQPSLPQLQKLVEAAQYHVVVAEDTSMATTGRLGGNLPVLITGGEFWMETAELLDDIFLGDAEIRRRSLQTDAGPRGGDAPVISEDGDMLLDIQFYEGLKLFGEDASYSQIIEEIESVEGVVAHGLIVGAQCVVIANKETGRAEIVVMAEEEPV